MSAEQAPSALRRATVPLAHGLVGRGGSGAGLGPPLVTLQTTLVLHALLALPRLRGAVVRLLPPLRPHDSSRPRRHVAGRLIIALDAFVIAPFVEGSYAMFASVLGTYFPSR